MTNPDDGPSVYRKTVKNRRLLLQLAIVAVTAMIIVLCCKLANTAMEKQELDRIRSFTPTPGYTPKPTGTNTPTPTETPTPPPIVMIDPGHGGKDVGSDAGKAADVTENTIDLSIAVKVRDRLLELGYEVIMTREEDVTIWPEERRDMYEASDAEVFVSIHLNAGPVGDTTSSGCEVYYNAETNEMNSVLAECILTSTCETTGARNRGIKENVFAVLQTERPACLIECGFISSVAEYELLTDEGYQENIALGIALGIDKYLKKKKGLTKDIGNQ